jgi:glyoxylase-like metal-dependent hydrolase (beta-lactamase superfamily II)
MIVSTNLRVAWFVSPNPGPLTLDGTCCYAVGRERVVLVDPGPAIPGQIERLERLVANRPVDAICLTHAHADHSGLAMAACERFGSPLAASAETLRRMGVDGNAVDDGDEVETDEGAARLRVIRTPGHSSDHVVFLLEPGRAVFTGDLVLGTGSSAILHPDGDVGSCLASFRRVLSERPGRLYPGHGPPVDDGEARLRHYEEHRAERHAQVVCAVRSGARSVAEMRRLVYGDIEADLRGAAEASIRAHLVHMRELGEEVPTIDGLDGVSLLPEEA